VVIISIDGLRPDAIDLAPMPILQGLMQTGAYSLTAQTIMPSTTLPANTSMLSGLCPSAHGVDWDEYLPEKGYASGTDLFDLAHAAGLRTVMVAGKQKLQQVVEPDSLDTFQWVNDPDPIVARRAAALVPQGFSVLFLHLPDTDLAGHAYGWLSLQQLLSLRGTDDAVQTLLDALDSASMRQNTLIMVTADHGGHNTSHGFDIPADTTIPWIINGPGVVRGILASPVSVTDTAATAAWALDLPLPAEWNGRPVLEAFGLPDGAPRPQPRCP
jgi:predicted AlkP superfamily pyrophosphatase or phosphodiesterase